jgi:hypothetical protein
MAKKTVKKAPKQKIQSSEELAIMLGRQYTILMQTHQNISEINKELEKRISLSNKQDND